LIEAKVARKLLRRVLREARRSGLLSNEHFTVDGTLIESWAAVKSMRRRDGSDDPPSPGRNATVDFHGERRTNETHVAPHDPEAKLYRKARGMPAKLHYLGHVLMEHRTGLPIDVEVTEANGFAERAAALRMLDRLPRRSRRTLAADKAYDTADFVTALRDRRVTPHVAANTARWGGSALDRRTLRHAGYRASQRLRKRVEEIFGWGKDGRAMRKMKVRGLAKVSFIASLTVGCYALLRVARLTAPPRLVST
jgi:IS5 family transposase